MYLSKYEEKMLNGEFGEAVSVAMKVLVKFGDSVKAERLITVNHVHISGISVFNIGRAGTDFIEDLMLKGARFSAFTTANPYAAVNLKLKNKSFPKEIINMQERVNNALRIMGARAFTCAPYFIRRPGLAEHIAWAESNAVLYANSVCGALTNREGGPLALMEAITGRAPYWGMHLLNNRFPEVLVSVPKPSSYLEAAVCGYLTGLKEPRRIPLIEGLENIPEDWVRAFLAGLGTSSQTPLAIIKGVSPDYREGMQREVRERLTIETSEVAEFIKENEKDIDKVGEDTVCMFGCPHLSVKEVNEIVESLMSVNRHMFGCEVWLVVGNYVNLGNELLRKLRERGVKVLRNVCPVVTRLSMLGVNEVLTDSTKALHYMPRLAGVAARLIHRSKILRSLWRG